MPETRVERSPEEEAALHLKRLQDEAAAELVDEKVKMAVYGAGLVGACGVFVLLLGAWRDNIPMLVAGATIALVSFGVVTAAQAGKLFGRGT